MTITTVTLAAAFSHLLDKVNHTIEDSIQTGESSAIDIELEAGREISLAIEGAKNAFEKELKETTDKVSATAKKTLDQLSTIVDKFEKGNAEAIKDIRTSTQQVVNALPFSSKQPQVTSIAPNALVPGSTAQAVVHFLGNFFYAAKEGFTPVLKLSDRVCTLTNSTTQCLEFSIDSDLIQNAHADKFARLQGNLQVFWDDGWVWSHKAENNYRIGLNILPNSPGKITVEYASHKKDWISQAVQSPYYIENGNNYYPQRWHTKIETIYPAQGWMIDVTKPPALVAFHEHGKHQQSIESVTPQQIAVKIGLHCSEGKDIGIFHFRVDYTVTQEVTNTTKRTEDVSLKWGDSLLLTPNDDEEISRIVFNSFNGSHQEFVGPDLSNPYLKLASQGNGVMKIWAEIPKD